MKAHLKAGSMLGTWIVPMDGWYDISVRLVLDAAEEARKDLQAEVKMLRLHNEGQAAKQSAAAALPFVLNEWADEVFASRDDLATEHKEQAKAIMLGALTNIFVSKDGQAGRMSDWAKPEHAYYIHRRALEHDSFKVIEGLDRTFAAIFGGAGIN